MSKAEFEMMKNKIRDVIAKREALAAAKMEADAEFKAFCAYIWTMDEARDRMGELIPTIDLGDRRIERRVTPIYEDIAFQADCPEEFENLRLAASNKAYENYTPSNTEMEAVYTSRPDGDELKAKHREGEKIVFASAKNAN